MQQLRLVLIGPPGVGKGTQAALLRERLGALQLSTGDIFRSEIKLGTQLGKTAKEYIDKGQLVPDHITIELMRDVMKRNDIKQHGFILDGFPRTAEQAKHLDSMLKELDMPLNGVIALDVDDKVVIERISGRLTCPNCHAMYHVISKPPKEEGICDVCGHELITRTDDRAEVVAERLDAFRHNTQPVIDYYQQTGQLKRVDASKGPEEVYSQILEKLQEE